MPETRILRSGAEGVVSESTNMRRPSGFGRLWILESVSFEGLGFQGFAGRHMAMMVCKGGRVLKSESSVQNHMLAARVWRRIQPLAAIAKCEARSRSPSSTYAPQPPETK